ncbi:MAG: CDP-alcohol phosphatidyltransferase family protein [Gemmatimonadales bacterium]|jgi:phosphatidylglycerophosphate synthase
MKTTATSRKLPATEQFVDLSDYARPVATWLARQLAATPIHAPHVTVVWVVIGLLGAFAYARGGYGYALLGALALQAKNVLDAVDGSLARLQRRPSRIGRFLDSMSDALIAAAVHVALAVAIAGARSAAYAGLLAGAALVTGLLQGSLFNYYYVRYRARRGGDVTSRVKERLAEDDRAHYAERPAALAFLRLLLHGYNWVYGWQDRLVQRIDAWSAAPLMEQGRRAEAERLRDDRTLMTAISALGPGLSILVLDLYTVAGYRHLVLALELYLWTVLAGGTLYATAIVGRLRRVTSQVARRAWPV